MPYEFFKIMMSFKFPAKINLTCRIQSAEMRCLVYLFGDPHECRRTNEIFLREFLASLKGQHRWQKPAIKLRRNVPRSYHFAATRFFTREKFVWKIWKYLIPAKTFGWKTHKVVGRACRRLSLTYWLDSRRSWTFRPSAAARYVKRYDGQRDIYY